VSAAPTATPRPGPARLDAWLTLPRLRAHAALLAVCLWSVLALGLSGPGLRDRSGVLKGADFLQFYVFASLAREGRTDALYDYAAHVAEGERRVPESRGTTYLPVYGPQVALLFAPLARLDYARALGVFLATSALLYALCVAAVWRTCPRLAAHAGTAALLALGYPAFFSLIGCGQSSALVLACATGTWLALRGGRPFLAGLALGGLAYKPQLALGAGLVLLAAGEIRVLAGAALSAAAQLAAAALWLGAAPLLEYAGVAAHLGELAPTLGFKLHQMHSLRAFFELLAPRPVATVAWGATAAATVGIALRVWRSELPLGARFAALLVASALVNPHQYLYDLALLAPAGLLLADHSLAAPPERRGTPALRVLLYACFLLPALGPLARVTHLQLSVPALAGVLWVLFLQARAGSATLHLAGGPAPSGDRVLPRGA
jgi:hypothetical protein